MTRAEAKIDVPQGGEPITLSDEGDGLDVPETPLVPILYGEGRHAGGP